MGERAVRQTLGFAMALVLAFGMCVPTAAAHAASELATAASAQAYAHEFALSSGGISVDGIAYDAAASGADYEISKKLKLTITAPGTYRVTGTRTDAAKGIAIEASDVTLVLDGVTLSTTDEAPISVKKGASATLDIESTVTLTDKETSASNDNDPDGAAIKVKSGAEARITGSGTLNANGDLKNGIKGAAEAEVVIGASAADAVKVNVTAANNGIASDGGVVINGGTVTVDAGNDGIKSEPDEGDSASAGTITMNGGSVNITSAGDGIQSTGTLDVEGGAVAITAGGGSTTKLLSTDESCKGLKSSTRVLVNGGTFDLDTADDCIHSDGNVDLFGGTFNLQTHNASTKPDNMGASQTTTVYEKGGDAVHADHITTIGKDGKTSTPVITATKCYEGLEGAEVNVAGGTVKVTAADDGINAANSDLTNYSYKVTISGGDVLVSSNGDGIDSNGTAAFSGGKIEVYSSATNGAEEAIDCDGDWTVSGAQLLAVGGTGVDWKVPASGVYVNFGATGGMGNRGGMNQGNATFPGGSFGNGQQGNQQISSNGQNQFGGFGGFGNGGRQVGPMSESDETGDASNLESQAISGGFGGNMGGGASIIQSGQTVTITDGSNNTLYSTTAKGSGTTAFFAHPSLEANSTYTMTVNGSTALSGTAAEGSSSATGSGGFPNTGNQQPGGNRPDSSQQQPGGNQPAGGQQQPGEQPAEQDGTGTETNTNNGTNTATDSGAAADNRADLADATVSPIAKQGYTGKAITPKPTVTVAGATLAYGTDYTLTYDNNVKRGTATITIKAAEGSTAYKGSTTTTFKIVKGANTMRVTPIAKTVSQSKVQNATKKLNALSVSKAKGSVTYKRVSGSKYLKVNAAGKIVVAKGTPAGKYTMKVKVRAAGNSNFKAKTVTKTVKVVVK